MDRTDHGSDDFRKSITNLYQTKDWASVKAARVTSYIVSGGEQELVPVPPH